VLPENYITIMTIINQPFSRGSIHITSADVHAHPEWDPKYNSNPLDMELLARAVQFVERIVEPSTPFGGVLKSGGKRQPALKADDLETAREIVRQRQISVFHVTSSCAMLPRGQGGVVDERLRVYGTKKLRVVDASVIPIEPVGNIQSVVYAVAERAADFIKEDRKKA
jgi:choline dehydrogenase-like flavoprotein